MSNFHKPKAWKDLIHDAIQTLPREFTLDQLAAFEGKFSKSYPTNKNIDAKVRQTLQILRDQGTLEFLGKGKYRRLDLPAAFSLQLRGPERVYKSKSQIGGNIIETWVETNLFCVACGSNSLRRLPRNTKLADFDCQQCSARYQVKATGKPLKDKILGAAFAPLHEAALRSEVPNYICVQYDEKESIVRHVRVIPGRAITADRVLARKKLGPHARRHGFQGCNVNAKGLPFVEVTSSPQKQIVRKDWKNLSNRQ